MNVLPFGNMSDPLDDLYGAIGIGTMKIAVTGLATKLGNGRTRIEVDEYGVYLRDTYDFNDGKSDWISQPLGYWGWSGVEKTLQLRWDIEIEPANVEKSEPDNKLYAVQNDDFRAWRKRFGRGCDFVIFSDVARYRLDRPKVIEL